MKLAVTSKDGKEAIVAMLGAGEFFGDVIMREEEILAVLMKEK